MDFPPLLGQHQTLSVCIPILRVCFYASFDYRSVSRHEKRTVITKGNQVDTSLTTHVSA